MSESGKIFNEVTILQTITLWFNDQELFPEDIISLNIDWDMDSFPVHGKLMMKDSFNIADLELFDGTATLKIYAKDFHNETFSKVFHITNVTMDEFNERYRTLNISFIDRSYFKLVNTYLSKSFNGSLTDALSAYMTHLELSDVLTEDGMTEDFESGESDYFAIPQNQNVFDFFNENFRKQGFRWWQDRTGMYVKKVDYNALEEAVDKDGNTIFYANDTDNDKYAFKIHDFVMKYNDLMSLNTLSPISKSYKYDPLTKTMELTTNNLKDVQDTLSMNSKPVDELTLQHTVGERFTTQELLTPDNQKLEVEDLYSNNDTLNIVVPGNFKYNKIGQIVNVSLKGNAIINESSLRGDVIHSGKYVVKSIKDRYLGDKLIQKLVLSRIDFQKQRIK